MAKKKVPTQFSERDVQLTIANPIYTGISSYPKIIPDDIWVQAATRMIAEDGVLFWLDVQTNIIQYLKTDEAIVHQICQKAQNACKGSDDLGVSKALKDMLTDLRSLPPQKKMSQAVKDWKMPGRDIES